MEALNQKLQKAEGQTSFEVKFEEITRELVAVEKALQLVNVNYNELLTNKKSGSIFGIINHFWTFTNWEKSKQLISNYKAIKVRLYHLHEGITALELKKGGEND